MAKQLYVFNNRINFISLVTPGGKVFSYNRTDVVMSFDGIHFSNFDAVLALPELTESDREDLELLKCSLRPESQNHN